MSVKISGILKDGAGKPIPNCTIELKSKKTSLSVITQTEAHLDLDRSGSYSIDVEPCHYDVSLYIQGFPTKHVGDIHVYSDSRPGTLNDFLMMPEESDLTPEVILIFQQLRDEAKAAAESAISNAQSASADADSAATSAAAAAISETNAGQSAQSASTDAESAASSATAAASSETNAEQSAQSASTDAESAASSAIAAKSSETNAGQSAQSASTDAESAATSAAAAESSENNAKASAQSASADAENAASSATAAASSETNAGQSAQSASTDAESAAASAAAAVSSETNAKASETAAANSATSMENSVTQSAASAAAALSEANRAKSEADRAAAVLDDKQDKSDLLTAIAGLTTSENQLIYSTDVDTVSLTPITEFGRELISGDGIIEAKGINLTNGTSPSFVSSLLFKNDAGKNMSAISNTSGTLYFETALNTPSTKSFAFRADGTVSLAGATTIGGEVKSVSAYSYRHIPPAGSEQRATFQYNRGDRLYHMVTALNDISGGFSSLRPLSYSLSTGQVEMGVGGLIVGGNINCVSLTQTSDINQKIDPIAIDSCLEKLATLQAYSYTLKRTNEKGIGLIAQEIEKVFPVLVNTVEVIVGEDERYFTEENHMELDLVEEQLSVDYSGITALNTQAINELYEIVKKQAKEIETLKSK